MQKVIRQNGDSMSVCRIGDLVTGICAAPIIGHPRAFTGTWVTGSGDTTADGIATVRVGDIGVTDCGHHFVAVEGTATVVNDGLNLVAVGDVVNVIEGGVGVTVTGSGSVIA